MLKFQVLIGDNTYRFELKEGMTVDELKNLIRCKITTKDDFDLYVFNRKLEGKLNILDFSQNTDYIEVKFKNQSLSKLKSFFIEAPQLIVNKTLQINKQIINPKIKFNEKKPKEQLNKLINFLIISPSIIYDTTNLQFSQFKEKLKIQSTLSHIKQLDEDHKQINNNDTVFNILDDMIQMEQKNENENKNKKKQNNFIVKKQEIKKQIKHKSLSPQQEEYLIRKQKALQQCNDPLQKQKAKQLINDMRKQKQIIEENRKQKLNQSSDNLNASLEYYAQKRQQMAEQIIFEKRNQILNRLNEHQQMHQLSVQVNLESQQKIAKIKQRMKIQQDNIQLKDQEIKQIYLYDAKLRLEYRKVLAKPIRLSEINDHQEKYLENKELHKLQRDQKKIEQDIKIKAETKTVYKDQKILQEVKQMYYNEKNKQIEELKKRRECLKRKQKYSEIIQEIHRPSIHVSAKNSDSRVLSQDGYSRKKLSILEQLVNNPKEIKKIQSALSQNHITPKTKITENLKNGKVPDANTYFHLRVQTPKRLIIHQTPNHKAKDYLKEFERERISFHKSALPKIGSPQQELQMMQKIEEQAKKKEQLANVCHNDELQIEATDLYLKSVQAKLSFLENKLF